MLSDPWFYAAAVPAVILVGLAKGGFGGGLALIGVPMMALAIPAIEAAAIMLPILIVMDVVALNAWWRIYDGQAVRMLLPASIAGVAIAASIGEPFARSIRAWYIGALTEGASSAPRVCDTRFI